MRLFLTIAIETGGQFTMKRTPKWAFFIVAALILCLCVTSVFGIYTQYGDRTDTIIRGMSDIRWGIDIQGGVDVVFAAADDNANLYPHLHAGFQTAAAVFCRYFCIHLTNVSALHTFVLLSANACATMFLG